MMNRRDLVRGLGAVGFSFLFLRSKRADADAAAADAAINELVAEDAIDREPEPEACDISVTPQWAFRPERLMVSSSCASDFVIDSITIGGRAQFAPWTNGVPADMFSTTAMGPVVSMDSAAAGVEIKFRVRYVGNDPRGCEFTAAMIGYCTSFESAPESEPADFHEAAVREMGRRRAVLPIASGVRIGAKRIAGTVSGGVYR